MYEVITVMRCRVGKRRKYGS